MIPFGTVNRNYCTIFDTNYAAFGLSLFRSLQRFEANFKLYVLCWDDSVFEVLSKLAEPQLIPVRRTGFYEDLYREVQDQMNYGQQCWLAQPLFCEWLLEKQKIDHVIYMDADCYFFASPQPLHAELTDAAPVSASMVPHNFSPSLRSLAESAGRYCVQYNFFSNSDDSRKVLERWKRDCLLYSKSDPWHYPGQISLDHWREVSARCHEIRDSRAGVAVWNLENHDWDKESLPVIFYHFHGLYFPDEDSYDLGNFRIPQVVIDRVYRTYLREVEEQNAFLESRFPGRTFIRRKTKEKVSWLRASVRRLKRLLRGTYNVFPRKALLASAARI